MTEPQTPKEKEALIPTVPSKATPWIIIVLGVLLSVLLGVLAAVGIFGKADNVTTILAAIVPILATIAGLLVAAIQKSDDTHIMLNSQHEAALERDAERDETIREQSKQIAALLGFAEGVKSGGAMAKVDAAAEKGRYDAGAPARQERVDAAREEGRALGVAETSQPK